MAATGRELKALWLKLVDASVDGVPLHGGAVVGFTEDSTTPSWGAGQRQAVLVTGYLSRSTPTWDDEVERPVSLRLASGVTTECLAFVSEQEEPALGPGWTRVTARLAPEDSLRVANILRRAGA